MGFQLLRHEPVNIGVARIIHEQTDRVLHEWERGELSVDLKVHNARKSCKMIRGALRLVRDRFEDFDKEDKYFRNAARLLAASRQTSALHESFGELLQWAADARDSATVERLREIESLLHAQGEEDNIGAAQSAAFLDRMRDARDRVQKWRIRGKTFAAVEGGLKTIYEEGGASLEKAFNQPTVENLHDWRKQQKYHWYHVRLLEPIWKPVMRTRAKQLEKLSDLLGDDHDLAMLKLHLAERDAGVLTPSMDAAIAELLPLLDERRAELQRHAFRIGRLLYAESPRELVGRMKRYWKIWHESQEKPVPADDPVTK